MTAKHAPTMREALTQIAAVCADNAAESCDKALSLKFVADVARAALSQPESSGSIATCCVTGAIPGDGGACGDCDPCIMGEASVPVAVKRLIAEKNSLINRVSELEDRLSQPDPQPSEPKDEPYAYAYVYPHYAGGEVTRFSCGQEINGSKPVRAIPLYTRPALDQEKVALPGDGWRPIESAPKDGTFVLLYSPDSERNPFIGQWIEDNDYPDGGAWWSDCECSGFSIDADPTHFMPLPAPPAKPEGK